MNKLENKIEIEIETIRKLIWDFRSSLNRRESGRRCYCRESGCEKCEDFRLYREEIERDLDKYSYFKLKTMFENW